jgi:hypothetical protein
MLSTKDLCGLMVMGRARDEPGLGIELDQRAFAACEPGLAPKDMESIGAFSFVVHSVFHGAGEPMSPRHQVKRDFRSKARGESRKDQKNICRALDLNTKPSLSSSLSTTYVDSRTLSTSAMDRLLGPSQ